MTQKPGMTLRNFVMNFEDDSFFLQCELDDTAETTLFQEPTAGVGIYLGNGMVEMHWPEHADPRSVATFLRSLSEQALALAGHILTNAE